MLLGERLKSFSATFCVHSCLVLYFMHNYLCCFLAAAWIILVSSIYSLVENWCLYLDDIAFFKMLLHEMPALINTTSFIDN